jgi:hypothetical protein
MTIIIIAIILLFNSALLFSQEIFDRTEVDNNMIEIKSSQDLPVSVSYEVWTIFSEVINIQPLFLDYTTYDLNKGVTKNINAQFVLLEGNLIIEIFNKEKISEEILAHEALHAKIFIEGFPIFKWNSELLKIQPFNNLENNIQHVMIFDYLEKLGFISRQEYAEKFKREGLYLRFNKINLTPGTTKEHISILIATGTFSGLITGLNSIEVIQYIKKGFEKDIEKGTRLYIESKKYNLWDKKDNFDYHLSVSEILGLNKEIVEILIYNAENKIIKRFDPISGKLLNSCSIYDY